MIVKEIQAEIEERSGKGLTIDQHMTLIEVPTARTHDQHSRVVIDAGAVQGAGGSGEVAISAGSAAGLAASVGVDLARLWCV